MATQPIPEAMKAVFRAFSEAYLARNDFPPEHVDNHVASLLFLRTINPLLANARQMDSTLTPQQDKNIRMLSIAVLDVSNNAQDKKPKWEVVLTYSEDPKKPTFVSTLQPLIAQIGSSLRRPAP